MSDDLVPVQLTSGEYLMDAEIFHDHSWPQRHPMDGVVNRKFKLATELSFHRYFATVLNENRRILGYALSRSSRWRAFTRRLRAR